MYGATLYYITKSLSELPGILLAPLVLSLIVYWVVGLNNQADKFFIFCKNYLDLALALMQFAGSGYGYLAGALVNTTQAAITISPLLLTPFLMFAGFFSNKDSIPDAFGWIKFASVSIIQPFYYGFRILAINEFTDRQLDCEICRRGVCAECDPLSQLSIDSTVWENAVYLVLLSLAIRALALGFLYISVKRFNG